MSKVADFDAPYLHLAPPQRLNRVEFRGNLWHQKTRFPGLSCSIVCVIRRLAILVDLRLVTDRHRHRAIAYYRASIASRGKKLILVACQLLDSIQVHRQKRGGQKRADICAQTTTRDNNTHTHTPFNGPFSRSTRVSRYQKGKTNLDFNEARDSEWQ